MMSLATKTDFLGALKTTIITSTSNIILAKTQYRHDLASWLCVNKEIKIVNSELYKFFSFLNNVNLVYCDKIDWKCYKPLLLDW